MRFYRATFAIAVAWGLALAAPLAQPAAAQSLEEDLSACQSRDLDTVIRGCTGIINSSRIDRRNRAAAYVMRGNAFSRQGDLDNAISDFSAAVRANPRSLAAFYNRGNANIVQRNFDEAIIDFSRAISLQPDHAPSYSGRGNAYMAKGDVEQAIAEYDKALEIDPYYSEAAGNRALAYSKDGDIGGALRNFGALVRVFFRSLFASK